MVSIATGWWYDYSQPAGLQATITVSAIHGGYLLSALTVLVIIAGASFWQITAFILHAQMAQREDPDTVHLQIGASLRNNSGALGTIWTLFKIQKTWKNRAPALRRRTGLILLPAALVLVGFYAASILTSKVANRPYGAAVARVNPHDCGFWAFNATKSPGAGTFAVTAAYVAKVTNDTTQARTYMINNYYGDTSVSVGTRSTFQQSALPFHIDNLAPCPIPDADRCSLGPNGALAMTTDLLDSHTMLGINSRKKDRIQVQASVTCSPISTDGLVTASQIANQSAMGYYLGPNDGSPFTYSRNPATTAIGSGYILESAYALAGGAGPWQPISNFQRNDADVTAFFLEATGVGYATRVSDPWFSANGTSKSYLGGLQFSYDANQPVSIMICADQYKFCNPSNGLCIGPTGKFGFNTSLAENEPSFNPVQLATIVRINVALPASGTYYSVAGLGSAALFATSLVFDKLSPGLPEDQWRKEAIGWFQTSLAKLQSYMVEYASNNADLGPLGQIVPPPSSNSSSIPSNEEGFAAWRNQCHNQLIKVAGQVQSFSAFGVLFIVFISVTLLIISLSLESCVDLVNKRRKQPTLATTARATDNLCHLVRMALPPPPESETRWQNGSFASIPTLVGGNPSFRRLGDNGGVLPMYSH